MSTETQFVAATPVLASLDIERSVEFFRIHLGFNRVHMEQGVYGIVSRDTVHIHFWACDERHIAENTSCRIRVQGLDALYAVCTTAGIVHPNALLDEKPWGAKEFAVLDPDGNLITFAE
ncbi:bleomycin resistance protein [Rhodoferax ferrireducens]|uniref:bleomycin resistance protein n=1 Tax=Rhodoferax ferrireducens TaxID=192843 RepID=UPI000E0CC482|nr:VOC family protein [Rhodoferax ferrireducens]